MPTEEVRQLARIYQPTHYGERNKVILDYVRALRRTKIIWNPARLRSAFGEWWGMAHWSVRTKDRRFSYSQVLDAWHRCPEQFDGLDIVRLKKAALLAKLPEGAARLPERLRGLLGACMVLQTISGGESFFLSLEDAGRLIGGQKVAGMRALRKLGGFIERLTTGSNLTGRASTYRVRRP
jgi:hypothetical protein